MEITLFNFTLGSWSILLIWVGIWVFVAMAMKGTDYEEKVSKPFVLPLSRMLMTAIFIDMVLDPEREVWEFVIACIYLFLQCLEIVGLLMKGSNKRQKDIELFNNLPKRH